MASEPTRDLLSGADCDGCEQSKAAAIRVAERYKAERDAAVEARDHASSDAYERGLRAGAARAEDVELAHLSDGQIEIYLAVCAALNRDAHDSGIYLDADGIIEGVKALAAERDDLLHVRGLLRDNLAAVTAERDSLLAERFSSAIPPMVEALVAERDVLRGTLIDVALPPCPKCEGTGRDRCWCGSAFGAACQRDGKPCGHAESDIGWSPACPSCKGSGVDRVVPESKIRAWIEEERRNFHSDGFPATAPMMLDRLARWLDT